MQKYNTINKVSYTMKMRLGVNQKIILLKLKSVLLKIRYMTLTSQSSRIKLRKYLKRPHNQTNLYHIDLNYLNHIVVKLIDQIKVYRIQFKKICL